MNYRESREPEVLSLVLNVCRDIISYYNDHGDLKGLVIEIAPPIQNAFSIVDKMEFINKKLDNIFTNQKIKNEEYIIKYCNINDNQSINEYQKDGFTIDEERSRDSINKIGTQMIAFKYKKEGEKKWIRSQLTEI